MIRQAAPPPPRWARRAATLALVTTVPSGLWRMAMVVGIPVGASDQIRDDRYGFPGWGTAYVFGLTLLLVALASLTLGLVQQWGETVPRWIPLIGGKPVPPIAAVIPAAAGAIALSVLWVSTMTNIEPIWAYYGLDGAERILMMVCYTPLLLWGPLLAAVTISYHRRHAVRPNRDTPELQWAEPAKRPRKGRTTTPASGSLKAAPVRHFRSPGIAPSVDSR